MNFSSRLINLIAESPHKQKEISVQTGISESALANYKKDRVPKSEELFRLSQFFNVSMEYLLTGKNTGLENAMRKGAAILNPEGISNEVVAQFVKTTAGYEEDGVVGALNAQKEMRGRGAHASREIPVLGWAHAGEIVDYDEIESAAAERVPTLCKDPQAFALDIEGGSMIPLVNDRDRVVVMPSTKPYNGCIVVARLKGDGVICRKIEVVGGRVRLVPANSQYSPSEHNEEDFDWVYPVFGTWSQLWRG